MAKASESEDAEIADGQGLMGGITAYHIRMLCEPGWEGGGGYTMHQVGQMTLDQIWFRLCNKGILKSEIGDRSESVGSLQAAGSIEPDDDGLRKGRDREGNPIRGKIQGESVARKLMNAQKERLLKQRKDEHNGTRIG